MRASRLLQILLLLQNRGRMTCASLARELEVTRRTILRDVDALTEAGLPIIVTRGNQGGIALGFNYRTRLTGLAADEAEALAVLLSQPRTALEQLGMRAAGERAVTKLLESFPDKVRETIATAQRRFVFETRSRHIADERITALVEAIRGKHIVTICMGEAGQRVIHPTVLADRDGEWRLLDRRSNAEIAVKDCGAINISARRFE